MTVGTFFRSRTCGEQKERTGRQRIQERKEEMRGEESARKKGKKER